MERNSDKTSEVSTQVKDTSNKGKSITTQEILDHTRGTSAGENSNLTVMTPSEPRGMHNTGSVSTTTSRRNLSTKTGKCIICQIVHLEQNYPDCVLSIIPPLQKNRLHSAIVCQKIKFLLQNSNITAL
jgi:hypothetical protein